MKRATLYKIVLSLTGALCLSLNTSAQEKPANQVLKFSFEADVQKWQAVGTALSAATIAHTTDPANIHTGKGTLQYDYKISPDEKSGAIVPLRITALAKMKMLRLWVKPDHNTSIVIVLQERGGGRYATFGYVKGGQWNEVALAQEDFILSTGVDDPKDPDGKLDLEQVESLAIADYSQWLIYGAMSIEKLEKLKKTQPEKVFEQTYASFLLQKKIYPYRQGQHTLYIDDIEALTDAMPELTPKKGSDTILDSFERPQPSWIPLGSVKALGIESSKPLIGKSLKIEYQVTPDMFGAVTKNLTGSFFTKDDKIGLTVASVKPIRLLIQVEDKNGGRYNTTFNLTGDMEARELTIAWKELTIAPDSKTKLSLDPTKIVRVFFMDITGALDMVTQENTLWINSLRAIH